MTDPERHAREAALPRLDPNGDLAAPEPGGPYLTGPSPDPEGPGVPAAAAPTAAPTSEPLAAPTAAPTAEPLASVIAKPRSSSGRGTSLLMALAAAIAIGGIAFAAGRLTAPATAATTGRLANGQLPNDGQAFPGRADGFGGVTLTGTVRSVSADSITLELATGTQVTIPLSSSTTYHSAVVSSADAVAVGSEVSVTPGARTADPNATPDPSASPGGALGGLSFGPASDVTVIEK